MEQVLEKRAHQRYPLRIEAYVAGDRKRRLLVSKDVSPAGVFFEGTYPVKEGQRLHLRIRINDPETNNMYYLDSYLTVTRIDKDKDGTIKGFGGQWIRVSNIGDITPLRIFLKNYINVAGGFIHVLSPETEDGVPIYSFTFPREGEVHYKEDSVVKNTKTPEASHNEENKVKKQEDNADVDNNYNEGDDNYEEEPNNRPFTRIYATLPVKFEWEGHKIDATIVKLKLEGVRIDTSDFLPSLYSPVKIEIPISSGNKKINIVLNGTVILTKKLKSGSGGQFEVKFSLKNKPAMLQEYRNLLKELQKSVSSS